MTDTIHAALEIGRAHDVGFQLVAGLAAHEDGDLDGVQGLALKLPEHLAGVLDHVRPILAKHGLYVAQYVTNDDTHVRVTTSIGHTTGESIDCGDVTWPMPDKVQVFGGLITYLRRYALTAALGLSGADDDDDGAQANDHAKRDPRTSGNANVRSHARASVKQIGYLTKLMREQGVTEVTLNEFAVDRFGWELPQQGLELHVPLDPLVEILDRILDMRRHLTLMESEFPTELGKAFGTAQSYEALQKLLGAVSTPADENTK